MRKTLDAAAPDKKDFYVVSGMGDDSVMMIAEMYVRGYEPKAVIFCDTGSEWPYTYKFIAYLSKWMMSRNWSNLVILKKKNSNGDLINVYDDNFKNGRMPPPVYGSKTCSHKFKTEVANRFIARSLNKINPAVKPRSVGVYTSLYQYKYATKCKVKNFSWKGWEKKAVKAIGINADEDSRIDSWLEEDCFEQVYPLVDWGIGEHEAKDTVESVGLYMPGKSSCFMCPNSKPHEVVKLYEEHPLMFYKAIAMEKAVEEQANDLVLVDRVFVVNDAHNNELPLSDVGKYTKKKNKEIDLERTFNAIPKKKRLLLRLECDDSQGDMFAIPESRLEIRKVEEKTAFVGLGRSKSWLDVVRGWQMTGQVDFIKCGGDMCGKTECGT